MPGELPSADDFHSTELIMVSDGGGGWPLECLLTCALKICFQQHCEENSKRRLGVPNWMLWGEGSDYNPPFVGGMHVQAQATEVTHTRMSCCCSCNDTTPPPHPLHVGICIINVFYLLVDIRLILFIGHEEAECRPTEGEGQARSRQNPQDAEKINQGGRVISL